MPHLTPINAENIKSAVTAITTEESLESIFEKICNCFLDYFNYCDDDGQRNSSYLWNITATLFRNLEMTGELTAVGSALIQEIKAHRDDHQPEYPLRFQGFSDSITRAANNILVIRSEHGSQRTAVVRDRRRGQYVTLYRNTPIPRSSCEDSLNQALRHTIRSLEIAVKGIHTNLGSGQQALLPALLARLTEIHTQFNDPKHFRTQEHTEAFTYQMMGR